MLKQCAWISGPHDGSETSNGKEHTWTTMSWVATIPFVVEARFRMATTLMSRSLNWRTFPLKKITLGIAHGVHTKIGCGCLFAAHLDQRYFSREAKKQLEAVFACKMCEEQKTWWKTSGRLVTKAINLGCGVEPWVWQVRQSGNLAVKWDKVTTEISFQMQFAKSFDDDQLTSDAAF